MSVIPASPRPLAVCSDRPIDCAGNGFWMHDQPQDEQEDNGMLTPPSPVMRDEEYELVSDPALLQRAHENHSLAGSPCATPAQLFDRAFLPTPSGVSRRACVVLEGDGGREALLHVHKRGLAPRLTAARPTPCGWALRDTFLVQAFIKYTAKNNGRAAPYTQETIKALGLPLDMLTDLQSTPGMYILELFIHGSMILVMQRCSTGSVVAKKLIQDHDVTAAHCVKAACFKRPPAHARPMQSAASRAQPRAARSRRTLLAARQEQVLNVESKQYADEASRASAPHVESAGAADRARPDELALLPDGPGPAGSVLLDWR